MFLNRAILVFSLMLCFLLQVLPIFPTTPPPAGGGKFNMYGWPTLALTTAQTADRMGNVKREGNVWRIRGLAINFLTSMLGCLAIFMVLRFLVSDLPRVSILNLLSMMTGVAAVFGYFECAGNILPPIAAFSDETGAEYWEVQITDIPWSQQIVASIIVFSTPACLMLLAGKAMVANRAKG